MNQPSIISCPHCDKRYRISEAKLGKNLTCGVCQQKFFAAGPTPPPLPVEVQTADDSSHTWSLAESNGQVFNGLSYNDIQNLASQGRLTMHSVIFHPIQTENQWIAATRFEDLCTMMRNSSQLAQYGNASQARTSTAPVSVPILISAIANIIVGLLWVWTVCGIPLAIACFVLCIFEFIAYGNAETLPREDLRSRTLILGISEIIVGLFNLPTMICGIIVLVNRGKI